MLQEMNLACFGWKALNAENNTYQYQQTKL